MCINVVVFDLIESTSLMLKLKLFQIDYIYLLNIFILTVMIINRKLNLLIFLFVISFSSFGQQIVNVIQNKKILLTSFTDNSLISNLNTINEIPLTKDIISTLSECDGENCIVIDGLFFGKNEKAENLPIIWKRKPGLEARDLNYEGQTVSVGESFSSGTVIKIPEYDEVGIENMKVVLLTPDSKVTLDAGDIFLFSTTSKKNTEERCIKGDCEFEDLDSSKKKKSKKKSSSHSADTQETQLAKSGTEFTIKKTDSLLTIELFSGELIMNQRKAIELPGNSKIDNLKRLLYTTEISYITPENSIVKLGTKADNTTYLETEEEIDSFFKIELIKQRQVLRNGGKNSRKAYNLLQKGNSLGISMYEVAMDNGEINRDQFIQASLIFIEGNYRAGNFKNEKTWLDANIYFNEQEHNYNNSFYNYFNDTIDEVKNGFGRDLVTSKEYFAWAYTMKLYLYGCLEAKDIYPREWRKQAEDIRNQIESPD